jgi:ABC-type antimicrobial peptide transport system permease subunit
MQNAMSFDADTFADAIQVNMNSEELTELMTAMISTENATCDNNLKTLGYADMNKPSEISIYPESFEGKTQIINILDAYNDAQRASGDTDKVISYTDVVGTLMSSVTSIVDTISYVLVAFVAISLIVSSIMIGVITYISVLERKKEIGILRAIGASKHNISQVFNAETFLIGLAAGCLGVGLTELLLLPINKLIHLLASNANVNAALPVKAAVVLVVLSVLLTLLGGFIPAKKAARSDPVTALRSE